MARKPAKGGREDMGVSAPLEMDLDGAISWLKKGGHKRVVLQLPEGLKRKALEVISSLEKGTGAEVTLSGDPCFGACDIPGERFRSMGFDSVVHVGHGDIGMTPVLPTLFVPVTSKAIDTNALSQAARILKEKGLRKVAVLTTVQHLDMLAKVNEVLILHGLAIETQKDRGMQVVLGCDLEAATSVSDHVDAYVVFASGVFHAQGVAAATNRPVIAVDPFTGEITRMLDGGDRFLRKRHAMIAAAKDAKVFGILTSSKPGQSRLGLAESLKVMVNKKGNDGMSAYVAVMDQVTPDIVLALPGDAFVNAACPRIALDDSGNYSRPVLTPQELEILLGAREWDGYSLDTILHPRRL
jgi:2-(3-amino-3-carboxypropyl)histidine synthase